MVSLTLALVTQLQMVVAVAPRQESQAAAFLESWCVRCHSGEKPKGKLDLKPLVARIRSESLTTADRSVLREARSLLMAGEMPPPEEDDRPGADDGSAGAAALRDLVRTTGRLPAPAGGPPRRLNRAEYTNAVRDLLGIDVTAYGALPPDEVGAGFDNVASVLSLSPSALERYIDLAESIAAAACPEIDSATPTVRSMGPADLHIQERSGRASERGATLWSNGEASTQVHLPRAGVYAIRTKVAAQQAGPEAVKIALAVDGKPIASFEIAEPTATITLRATEASVEGGSHRVGVLFLNDFYVKDGPDGKPQDRNVIVHALEVCGPIDEQVVPPWKVAMERDLALDAPATAASRERAELYWLISTLLRRPASDDDERTLHEALEGLEPHASRETRLRAALTALLAHPEFLFRVEEDPVAGSRERRLSDYESATRLAAFLWASVPDASLQRAAETGAFTNESRRLEVINEMLADPRASRLAARFASQWLHIDDIESRTPDEVRFPGIDGPLLSSMRAETVQLFDSLLRENRPATQLLDADYTFVDARLADHYGMPAPAESGVRRVPVDPVRGGGVLAHASVLLATSNPSRTSPVKRGKWVLEALLDAAPPPPPPGTAQLPQEAEDPTGKTMRQLLEAHRADPNCAACHRRMDALGFAFEQWDAVGRLRASSIGSPIDDHGDLPDGRRVSGLSGLRQTLRSDPAFVRSLVKHLLIYATGREQDETDEIIIDSLIEDLGAAPTLKEVVIAVAQSPSMRVRGAP